jgi:hypothetical protein
MTTQSRTWLTFSAARSSAADALQRERAAVDTVLAAYLASKHGAGPGPSGQQVAEIVRARDTTDTTQREVDLLSAQAWDSRPSLEDIPVMVR